MSLNNQKFIGKLREVNNLEIIENQSEVKRLSKDFYNYSPILNEKLDGCIADLVVRPSDHNAVKKVAAARQRKLQAQQPVVKMRLARLGVVPVVN